TRSLADGLGSPTLATAVVPFGPSFLRFRPVHGGVLSVSLLPISRKNRFLFESLLDSVDAVIVSGWSEAGSEAEDWTALIPQGLDLEILDETGDLGAELAAVLRRRAEGEIR
ncbi:MAG TPA: hypothetical protein PK413_02875, partial [Thermoanaerobaculia bacterium]|nr:hypothetical protein [Thermoanaerobaculia bacterium]